MSNTAGEGAGFTTDVVLTHEDGSEETVENMVVYFENGRYKRHLTDDEISYLESL